MANGSPSPFRHSQRNPPNWFTHLAVAGSQSFISSSYQAWSLKQPCFFTNDSVFIPRIASNFRFSVLNQCNVDAESRSLVFFFSSVREAWGEVGGHWRASYQLKKRVRGPRPRRGSCWKERKRLHPPIWSSHWLAPLTNRWFFYREQENAAKIRLSLHLDLVQNIRSNLPLRVLGWGGPPPIGGYYQCCYHEPAKKRYSSAKR